MLLAWTPSTNQKLSFTLLSPIGLKEFRELYLTACNRLVELCEEWQQKAARLPQDPVSDEGM